MKDHLNNDEVYYNFIEFIELNDFSLSVIE